MKHNRLALLSFLAFGYAFLYIPIFYLITFSFNESKLVTVWTGFSTHWYSALFENNALLNAAYLSGKIAIITATLATVLGTLAALALARYKRFPGRNIFATTVNMPLMLPDIIMGLMLLLLFVSLQQWIGWPAQRGITTIVIAHTTFCLAYVAIIVYSRLTYRERTLEEAAMDLGAKPFTVFLRVTLPSIWPALLAGWLLSFTLSLDDLVIASFVSGPGATTLPMYIYSGVRLGVTPEINALATILIVLAAVSLVVAGVAIKRK